MIAINSVRGLARPPQAFKIQNFRFQKKSLARLQTQERERLLDFPICIITVAGRSVSPLTPFAPPGLDGLGDTSSHDLRHGLNSVAPPELSR